jgi:hypothetical protein
VILVMLLGQSRVFYSMAHDGLVPAVFADIHPRYRTPYKSNLLFFVFTSLFAAFLPEDIVGEMTSIGTLFAFILVCAGVWIMRVRRPDVPRGFVVPALPVVAVLGIIVCGSMIYGLGWTNWVRLGIWLIIGLVFAFGYSRQHNRLETASHGAPIGGKVNVALTAPPCRRVRRTTAGSGPRAWAIWRSPFLSRSPRRTAEPVHRHRGGARGTRSTMAVITITTVGYKEVHDLSRAGQVLTVVLLTASVGAALYTFTLFATLVVEGALPSRLQERRLKACSKTSGSFHHLRLRPIRSPAIAQQFQRQHIPYVVIERDAER